MRKYEPIWEKIKDAPYDRWIEVTVSSLDHMQTVINGVMIEKSKAQVTRKSLNLPQFGRLVIKRVPKELKIRFALKNSGDAL